ETPSLETPSLETRRIEGVPAKRFVIFSHPLIWPVEVVGTLHEDCTNVSVSPKTFTSSGAFEIAGTDETSGAAR
ncbi:MAG: hypothetical protein VB853_01185, partial [Pirellulales bacterium]